MGAATVGPRLTIPFKVNTGVKVGQGNLPVVRARYSTDDFSDPTPNWTELTFTQMRAFEVSRGRETELEQHDAGTASITLDNRDRTFDPNVNALVRPLNRWWLYEEFVGEVHDLFYGYAESYEQSWPGGGWSDAECVVSLVDEFKVLALATIPTTDPPRSSYDGVIEADQPSGYWRLNDHPERFVQEAEEVADDGGIMPGPFEPPPHFRHRRGWWWH